MLGACASNKIYIGQDINSITVKETASMIAELNLKASVALKNSIYAEGAYECLFTCPPYYTNFKPKEIWHQEIEPMQSTDDWIDVCVQNYSCQKYLLVVDKTEKYKKYIAEEINNTSHFGTNKEKVILIQ